MLYMHTMSRYKISLEYDGTPFCGWQRQAGLDTIQQRIEESMLPFLKKETTIFGSGRTDAGVHALCQVAHFDADGDVDCFRLQRCMNALLVEVPICVLSVEKVADDFNARFSAIERSYLYKILNRKAKACLDANRVWCVPLPLDEQKMHTVAQNLVGKHDFSAFRAAGCQSKSSLKTINGISVVRESDSIYVKVAARSFLYHQVRNIVGSLKFVGSGKWSEENFLSVFLAKDRTIAGPTAPACGLYFVGTRY
ncbi:tRNA pseudouridine synthase A [Alphaproteobacteria bacterium]|nr:tRNA pseudouridine synthase A [Alphaproteobacteria bacterium]